MVAPCVVFTNCMLWILQDSSNTALEVQEAGTLAICLLTVMLPTIKCLILSSVY